MIRLRQGSPLSSLVLGSVSLAVLAILAFLVGGCG